MYVAKCRATIKRVKKHANDMLKKDRKCNRIKYSIKTQKIEKKYRTT